MTTDTPAPDVTPLHPIALALAEAIGRYLAQEYHASLEAQEPPSSPSLTPEP